ncbi:BTAD domain-containing putative transcriptional regulator [Nonomuraea sp. LPB2021202275-12-8]|uniref:BTAD domain-containing putative transcriptional regulator n=1 Tax=Nonomuraea sp. LPB2021202275-12-8 TaxID=3120159 RepID=UPI00300C8B2D
MRRHLVGTVTKNLTGPSLVAHGLVGLLVTFGLLSWRSRSVTPPAGSPSPRAQATDAARAVPDLVTPVRGTDATQGTNTTPATHSKAAGQCAPSPQARPTAVLDVATADRRGTIHLIGQCAIEGPNRTAGGWGTDTWALLGLLAEHRSSLLSKALAGDKLWPEAGAQGDRFAGLLKATRAKMCDALGMPGNYGRVVIQFKGGTGYRINPDLYGCDVWQIRDLLAAAAVATGPEKTAALTTAVNLYTGTYLPGVPHPWAWETADSLNRGIVQALAQLADLENQPELEIGYLERATELDGVAEHLYRRRMEVYARLGRPQALHYCYDELREQLRARGRKPSSKTEQLYRVIADSA